MSEAKKLLFPLLNPNETDGVLVDLHVKEGQPIKTGDILYTFETTKSTAEIEAESSGFLISIQVAVGDTVRAGDLFAYLAEKPDWKATETTIGKKDHDHENGLPEGLRITEKALALSKENDIDLAQFPIGPMITESLVQKKLAESKPKSFKSIKGPFAENAILVYGGGGHGKSVIDLLNAIGDYEIVGVIDDSLNAEDNIMGLPVLGSREALNPLFKEGVRLAVNAVGGIGNVSSRIAVFNRLEKAGFSFPTIVHPSAVVEKTATLSPGVQVFPLAYVGSDVKIGFGSIVNTGAIVSHDCQLGDYVNISPGAILAGAVEVGDRSLVGMGTTINLNAKVGEGCLIGNGATVKSDLTKGGIVRAGTIWPK